MRPRFVILHGWENRRPSDHWEHWLHDELVARGYEVDYPQLPDPDTPDLETWLGILDDLDWLGYRPDIYPTAAYREGRCEGRQSDRDDVYFEAFEILRKQQLVYACDCSRRVAAQSASTVANSEPTELRYTGHCRNKQHPIVDRFGWRIRIERCGITS